MALKHGKPGKERVSAELLRQSLAFSANPVEACPDPEMLAAYAGRALDAVETAGYERHFSQCARCREQLAAMARAAAPAAGAHPRRLRWVWPWTWFVLTPVTTAILIAAVFLVRSPSGHRVAEQQPLLAMQAPSQDSVPTANSRVDSRVILPSDRQSQPSASPKAEIPPSSARVRSENHLTKQAAPDDTAAISSETDTQAVSPAPTEKNLNRAGVADLPQTGRNYRKLESRAQPAGAGTSSGTGAAEGPGVTTENAKVQSTYAAVTQTPGGGLQQAGVEQPRVKAQTVTVRPQPAEGAPAASASAGATGATSSLATAKKPPAVFAGRALGALDSQMVAVGVPSDGSARTFVYSPDPQVMWRISGGRFIDMSADAGATWRTQWTSPTARVVAGSAPSTETCWVVGRGGVVLLTTDGSRWRMIDPPTDADFASVQASNGLSATISTFDGRRFLTRDGGKHWTPAP